jgi:tetratricopeptide (TPR) repeat protein
MTEREKFKTRGGYFLVVGNYPKAIEELTQLVENYPADFAGHTNLALAYFFTRKMGPAMEAARRATDIYPNNVVMRSNLALFSMYAGNFEGAAEIARDMLAEGTSRWRTYVTLALSSLAQGQIEEATEAYNKLKETGPDGASISSTGLADLALYQGRLAEAADILREGIASDREEKNARSAARKSMALAHAHLELGRQEEALAEAERVAGENQQLSRLYEAAIVFLRAGREDRALEIASELGKSLRQESRMYGKLIEGEEKLGRGETWDAIRLFHEAQELTDTWLGRFNLGRAYLEGTAFTEAYSEFEQCLKRSGEAASIFLDDSPSLRYLPPLHYYLGRAQEGLGSPAAADSYRTFLKIKEGSDQHPLVTDAQRRLAEY